MLLVMMYIYVKKEMRALSLNVSAPDKFKI